MKTLRPALAVLVLGLLTGAACDKEPAEPSPDCTSSIAPTSLSFGSAGASGNVAVTIAAGCAWTAQTGTSWLTVAPASGTGAATVSVTAAANPDVTTRTGSATVAGQTVSVSQAGRAQPPPTCTYDTSPASAAYTKDAGSGTVTVTTGADCPWSASSNASWVVITSPASGTGSSTVNYAVERNFGLSPRAAILTVAGKETRIDQQGDSGVCQYSVGPTDLSACLGPTGVTTAITTSPECSWTAASTVPWLTLPVQSGTGPASLSISVASNYDKPRDGVVEIRWPTPTAGQNVRVSQAGCFYSVSQSSFDVAAAGTTDLFMVYQFTDPVQCGGATQDACLWSPSTDVGWIVINTGTRKGDDRVTFTVLPNTTGVARAGTIRVRDQVVHVSQSGS